MCATMPCMDQVRDRSRGNRVLLVCFGLLALAGILIGAFTQYAEGDRRVKVVTLKQGVTQADRVTLKQACGSLSGVSVVADQGAADKQYRLPVRFDIAGTTAAQEAALDACIERYSSIVRGQLNEGDS